MRRITRIMHVLLYNPCFHYTKLRIFKNKLEKLGDNFLRIQCQIIVVFFTCKVRISVVNCKLRGDFSENCEADYTTL